MPDRTFSINSFKYGLDTRREALSSLPGTLVQAINCHVNSGGELDKRRAFVKDANLFPTNTFGLQDTDSGLMTFGSDAAPNASLPTGVVYQRLPFPIVLLQNVIPMTGVVASCCFLGKPFVLVTYSGYTDVFAFYNGSLVAQITDGIIQNSGGPAFLTDIATSLANIVNRAVGSSELGKLGWVADANVTATPADTTNGYNETALNGSVLVMSPPGIHFTPTITENNSAAGLLGVKLIDQNFPGIGAVAALVVFTLNAGTNGTVTVTSGALALSGGAVNFNTNLTQTATDIVTAINNNTFITGYSAKSVGAVITVYAPTSLGNYTGNLTIVTTGDITTTNTGTPFSQLSLTLTPPGLSVISSPQIGTTSDSFEPSTGSITASATGTTSPVTYTWVELDPTTKQTPDDIIFTCNGTLIGAAGGPIVGPKCTFLGLMKRGNSLTRHFQCTAHDGIHADAVVTFTVALAVSNT